MEKKLIAFLLALLCTFFMAAGQILWKLSADNYSGIWVLLSLYGILGSILYVIALLPFTYAVKTLDLSVTFPILALNYVWIALSSYYFLSESLGSLKLTGIFAIIMGAAFVGRGSKK